MENDNLDKLVKKNEWWNPSSFINGQWTVLYHWQIISRSSSLTYFLYSVTIHLIGNETVTPMNALRSFNSLRPRQNGHLFADDTFKRIFLNENIRISNKISLKFVPKGLINNIPAFVLIMAWRRPGDLSLSEPMLVRSLTHICLTRPQWVIYEYFDSILSWTWLTGFWNGTNVFVAQPTYLDISIQPYVWCMKSS